MSAVVTLDTEARSLNQTKGEVRKLRLQGRVPGVIYGKDYTARPISVSLKNLVKEWHQPGFFTRLFEMTGENNEKIMMIPRDIQLHPVTDIPLHIDFMHVSKDARLTVAVPLKVINDHKSPGIKRGGVLNMVLHTLEISTLPDKIPADIPLDLEGLEIGAAIHLNDIQLPEGCKAVYPERDHTLATLVAPSGLTDGKGEEASKES